MKKIPPLALQRRAGSLREAIFIFCFVVGAFFVSVFFIAVVSAGPFHLRQGYGGQVGPYPRSKDWGLNEADDCRRQSPIFMLCFVVAF
ncbi:MAG: hypothetical protein FVQ79_09710 [Planctomycetes bacterium]|nr:hypothetical protein [Planctomycetota bacterium]